MENIVGTRIAAITLSCVSILASLIVVISYARMLMRFRAHQRQILQVSNTAKGMPTATTSATNVVNCLSCESSLATPCANNFTFSPQPISSVINNPNVSKPVNRHHTVATVTLDKSHGQQTTPQQNKRHRLPRIPSSKIAILSGADLILHLTWIINSGSAAQDKVGCTVTLFFFQWIQLFHLFFLTIFVARSAARLRHLQAVQPKRQRRTDIVLSVATALVSLSLSALPAIMSNGAGYDGELKLCWFPKGDPMSLRWVWLTLNSWIILALLFLIAMAIYIGVMLAKERKNFLGFITQQQQQQQQKLSLDKNPGLLYLPPPNLTLTQPHQLQFTSPVVTTSLGGFPSLLETATRQMQGAFGITGAIPQPSPLPLYPPNHPIMMAHEALHGRRPTPTSNNPDQPASNGNGPTHTSKPKKKAYSIEDDPDLLLPCSSKPGSAASSPNSRYRNMCASCRHASLMTLETNRNSYSKATQRHSRGFSDQFEVEQQTHRRLSAQAAYNTLMCSGNESNNSLQPWDSECHLIPKKSKKKKAPPPLQVDGVEHGPYASLAQQYQLNNRMPAPIASAGCHMPGVKKRSVSVAGAQKPRHKSMPVPPVSYQHPSSKRNNKVPPHTSKLVRKKSALSEPCQQDTEKPTGNELRGGSLQSAIRNSVRPQMKQIERRVHALVAIGAVRVGSRALVPLITHAIMVVWSTLHSINALASIQSHLYAAAIILFSLQGLLDMALYFYFDTQSDASEMALPSANTTSTGIHTQQPQPQPQPQPPVPIQTANGLYSYDMDWQASSNWQYMYHLPRMTMAERRGYMSNGTATNEANQFAFNTDSLNIHRLDRTSNARQSDTLRGSDCMERPPIHHQTNSDNEESPPSLSHYPHFPVLNGWDEDENEEHFH